MVAFVKARLLEVAAHNSGDVPDECQFGLIEGLLLEAEQKQEVATPTLLLQHHWQADLEGPVQGFQGRGFHPGEDAERTRGVVGSLPGDSGMDLPLESGG